MIADYCQLADFSSSTKELPVKWFYSPEECYIFSLSSIKPSTRRSLERESTKVRVFNGLGEFSWSFTNANSTPHSVTPPVEEEGSTEGSEDAPPATEGGEDSSSAVEGQSGTSQATPAAIPPTPTPVTPVPIIAINKPALDPDRFLRKLDSFVVPLLTSLYPSPLCVCVCVCDT